MALLDKIRELCAQHNISLAQLEAQAGLGKKTLFRWNKISPSADKLKRVADYFDITVDELLKDIPEK